MKSVVRLAAAILPGPLRLFIYRRILGASIADGASIAYGAVIDADSIRLDANASIGLFVRLRARQISLGKHAQIGAFVTAALSSLQMASRSRLGTSTKLSGDVNNNASELTIGAGTYVMRDCFIDVSRQVRIGRNVGIGGRSLIFTHGSWLSWLDGFPVSFGPVTIEDDVWIPWDCFIMPNVRIGSRAIVGARSVVNRDVPQGSVAAGVPARVVRERSCREVTFDEKIDMLRQITVAFGARFGTSVTHRSSDGAVDILENEQLLLRIHSAAGGGLHPAADALNIYVNHIDDEIFLRFPSLCLVGQKCSPEGTLPQRVRDWLRFAGIYGVRYFPVDED